MPCAGMLSRKFICLSGAVRAIWSGATGCGTESFVETGPELEV